MPRWKTIVRGIGGAPGMKIIRSYSMQFEADLARIALEGADIPAVVVGVGMGMEGGIGGVQLLVPEHRMEAALKVLEEFEDRGGHHE
jgi:Putative prokaryotic signal transducing protein